MYVIVTLTFVCFVSEIFIYKMGSDRRARSRSYDRKKRSRSRDRRDRSRSRERDRHQKDRDRERKKERVPVSKCEKQDDHYGLKVPDVKPKLEANSDVKKEEVEKEGINLGLSGALTQDTNTFNGVVIKYAEPPEARIPKKRWRFYVFKGEETLPTLHLHRQSAYLIGRDRKVIIILL